ncbi:TonB-dependent receptor [Aquimarina sp. TRL1]|uniref:TonB-dependent receptor n=1 Tax=Aquimarina sp. (strain TRL1) TaxID=2736252 RepID=UPI00158A467D|nr:TonB-dependent receptor [Aquimarina sp. TRL1]QKX05455.1 TonB-dependent receptor [Aquimarina sp. TRL1]
MKRALLILVLLTTSTVLSQKTITGHISDTSGNIIPGASVIIEGTSTGTTSDFEGNFTIESSGNTPTLIVSFLGFKTKKISISSTMTTIRVQLEEDAFQLEDIVVTANKTTQRSQDVPLSITAVGAKELARTGSVKAEDYFPSIPNLSISASGGGGAGLGDGRSSGKNIAIRGISGTNTTAFYLDETPLPEFADPRLFDTDRIEVLRGPQGTLYGSNTMGGAVKVITNQPNAYKTSGNIDISGASVKEGDADYSIQGVFNIPILEEKLALRLGTFYAFETGVFDRKRQTHFNGFPLNTGDGTGANPNAIWDNPDGSGTQIPFTGDPIPITLQNSDVSDTHGWRDGETQKENVDDETSFGINAALGIYPSENLKIVPKFIYQKTEGDGLDFADFRPDNFEQYRIGGIDEKYELELLHSSLLIQLGLGEYGELTNNFSFSEVNQFDREDVTERESSGNSSTELTPFDENGDFADLSEAYFYPEFMDRTGALTKVVEELRYSLNNPDKKLNVTAGLFFSSETSKFDGIQPRNSYLGALSNFFGNIGLPDLQEIIAAENFIWFSQDTDFKTDEFALFSEIYWDITPKLKATFGLRYFSYKQELKQKLGGFVAAGGGIPTDEEITDDGFTPKLNLTYTINDKSLLYGSATRGYRLGGANGIVPVIFAEADLAALGLEEAPRTFESDFLWTYEIGSKNTFLQNRLIANASVFHTVWNDLQQRVFLPSGFIFVDNIGKATITGFDLEVKGKVSKNLQIGGAFGYVKAEVNEGSILTASEKGDRILNVPDITASANIQYSHQLKTDQSMFYRLDFQHTGERVNTFSPETEPQFIFDAFSILNARIGYSSSKFDIAVFGKNLTNEIANFGDIISLAAIPFGRYRYAVGRPASYGINVRYKF